MDVIKILDKRVKYLKFTVAEIIWFSFFTAVFFIFDYFRLPAVLFYLAGLLILAKRDNFGGKLVEVE
ncbi:MAG: hypothetical protein KAJ40_02755 [Alphaproteobacteria bacterium]|nr:hypothetical protein [Alphaproteobacteria bacterium]